MNSDDLQVQPARSGARAALACIIHEGPDSTAKGRDPAQEWVSDIAACKRSRGLSSRPGGHDGREGWAATAPPAERPMPPRKQVGAAQRVGYPARAPSASAMCRHASRCGVERGRCRTTRRTERTTTWTQYAASAAGPAATSPGCGQHAVRAARVNRSSRRLSRAAWTEATDEETDTAASTSSRREDAQLLVGRRRTAGYRRGQTPCDDRSRQMSAEQVAGPKQGRRGGDRELYWHGRRGVWR